MGGLAGLLGLGGGQGGTQFQTISGVTPDQLATAYQGTQGSLAQQQALLQALGQQGGIQNQQQVYQQLQDIAAGKTGNVAQAQLQQATGANVANQAALMAGQRGAGANVGLMARQAAQQGAQTQQQAAGQAAALQAQQQLGAIQGAGNLATTQVGQQMGAQSAATQAQLEQQQQLQAANTAYSQQQAQLAGQQIAGQQKLTGGIIGGAMQGIGAALGMADGGQVPETRSAGTVIGSFFDKMGQGIAGIDDQGKEQQNPFSAGFQKLGKGLNQAMKPTPITPINISAQAIAQGGSVGDALKAGGKVPGHAKVAGDSYENDQVHAMLSPGEIVIPRSVAQSANPVDGAARFVAAMQAKKGKK